MVYFLQSVPTALLLIGVCNRYAPALLPSKLCRAPHWDMVINHAEVLQH